MKNPLVFPLLLAVASVLYSAFKWKDIPASVPIWWNLDASPRIWAPKWVGVVPLPVLQLLIPYIIYLIISRDRLVDEQAGESKHAVAQLIMIPALFLFFLDNFVLLNFSFVSADHYFSPRVFVSIIALWLLILLGLTLKFVEANHSIGIVTPWTTENSRVWKRTHTHAGYVLPISGLVLLISGYLLPLGVPLLVVTLLLWLGSYVYLVFYSWYISGGPGSEPLISGRV